MKILQSRTAIVSGGSAAGQRTNGEGDFPEGSVLLEKGLVVFEPQCAACGRAFDPPRVSGEKFRVALQFLESGPEDKRLFVGNKVLIAKTSWQLSSLLDRSTTFVGERVLVATPWTKGDANVLVLFCARCGENVTLRTSNRGRDYYAWDWLAEFKPHGLIQSLGSLGRWKLRSRRRRSAAPRIDSSQRDPDGAPENPSSARWKDLLLLPGARR